jgi:hypothetical protein
VKSYMQVKDKELWRDMLRQGEKEALRYPLNLDRSMELWRF